MQQVSNVALTLYDWLFCSLYILSSESLIDLTKRKEIKMDTGNQDFNEINEEYLKLNDWWWRRLVLGEFQADSTKAKPFQIVKSKKLVSVGQSAEWNYWKKSIEMPTYKYELARRLLCRDKYLPWPSLSVFQQSFLLGELGKRLQGICVISDPIKESNDWSDPMQPWQWKLDASDKALCEKFMTMINEERRKKGMPNDLNKKQSKTGKSVSSNAGNHNRGVSWRGIELMDIQFFKIRKFENNSETSLVSKVKKEGSELSTVVKKCFKACNSWPGEEPVNKAGNFVLKFLKENFEPF